MDDLLNLEKLTAVEQRLENVKILMESILKLNEQMQSMQTMKFYFGMKRDEELLLVKEHGETKSTVDLLQELKTPVKSSDIPNFLKPEELSDLSVKSHGSTGKGKVTEQDKEFIKKACQEGEMSIQEIADAIGIKASSLRYQIDKMGLDALPCKRKAGRRKKDAD